MRDLIFITFRNKKRMVKSQKETKMPAKTFLPHKFPQISCVFLFAVSVAFLYPAQEKNKKRTLNSLLQENSHILEVENGQLSGEGFDFLMKAAAEAQCVAIAEEHNRLQIPQITTMLFSALHKKYGFNYLALEQGTVVCKMFASKPLVGNPDAIAEFVQKYTNAPTFITDQELQMIADAGRISDAKTDRIWGLDQEFGALHILDQLKELAPNDNARLFVEKLIEKALLYEKNRFASEKLFMAEVAQPEDFTELLDLFKPETGSKVDFLIQNLLFSNKVYNKNVRAGNGELTGYDSNLEREEHLKERFMTEYKAAQKSGDRLPKVVLKLGHWHVYRGKYRGNVYTFGNFLSEFAISNGKQAFILSTTLLGDPDEWRNSKGPWVDVVNPDKWTIIDFRPLRKYAHAKRIEDLSEGIKNLLFRVDAILIIGNSRPGTYTLTRDSIHGKPCDIDE